MPNPSTTVLQGQPAPPADPDCVELADNNITARQAIIDELGKRRKKGKRKTKKSKAARRKAKGKGMTVGSAKSTVPGAEATMTTSSDGTANAVIPNQQCGGGTPAQKQGVSQKTRDSKSKRAQKKKDKAGVLCGKSYAHLGGGPGAHAEAKAINCLTNMGGPMTGGSITFNTNWRSGKMDNGQSSGMPCPHCYEMMCHAAAAKPEGCGIKIYICDEKNQKQELSEDDCNSPDGYSNLSQRVDGAPTPGRKL